MKTIVCLIFFESGSSPLYNIHNLNSQFKLLARSRLRLSHLNEENFNHNFDDCIT